MEELLAVIKVWTDLISPLSQIQRDATVTQCRGHRKPGYVNLVSLLLCGPPLAPYCDCSHVSMVDIFRNTNIPVIKTVLHDLCSHQFAVSQKAIPSRAQTKATKWLIVAVRLVHPEPARSLQSPDKVASKSEDSTATAGNQEPNK